MHFRISRLFLEDPSTLTLHVLQPSPLLGPLTQTSFFPSLTHIISHPPILLTHLATAYLTPPPPSSLPEKFWGVFSPISERGYESEKLVFGPGGEGPGGGMSEFVVELVVRGDGRRRAVEKVLEGWAKGGPCELESLESLKTIWSKKSVEVCTDTNFSLLHHDLSLHTLQAGPDPTKHVSFNLNLTASQQQSRAQVPLPYAHEGEFSPLGPEFHLTIIPGKPIEKQTASAAILYDPDSADDIDDDDPDEDLDI